MLAVEIGLDQVCKYSAFLEANFEKIEVAVACINSPNSLTLSGKEDQLLALQSWLNERATFNRRLRVNLAYHSPQMSNIASEYLDVLGRIEKGVSIERPPFMISTVTGKRVRPDEVCNSQYWVENMTLPVRGDKPFVHTCLAYQIGNER